MGGVDREERRETVSRVTHIKGGGYLARFRVDPQTVRVSVRKIEDNIFLVKVEGATFAGRLEVRDAGRCIRSALMRALATAWNANMKGVDPYMEWAYDHPQYRQSAERVRKAT
jgi:hypothetical protein